MTYDNEPRKEPEVIPPGTVTDVQPRDADTYNQAFLALVSNYTDRPDLLVSELEKHDPGFVKRMNAASEKDAAEMREARFKFGKTQAYTSLVVSVLAAVVAMAAVLIFAFKGLGFWPILGVALFYAISQGGTSGFMRVIDGVVEMIRQPKDKTPGRKDDEPE